jgi:hypothetical protein
LPVQNVEDMDTVMGGLGAVPIGTNTTGADVFALQHLVRSSYARVLHVEERNNEQLWRSASNGTESHTSAIDEYNSRQLLCRDAVEALERVSEKDKNVPLPSLGKVNDLPQVLTFATSPNLPRLDSQGGSGLIYR